MRNRVKSLLGAVVLAATLSTAAMAVEKPKSVIHIINLKLKPGMTKDSAEVKAAMSGVDKLAAQYPGIKRVWLRPIKVQGDFDAVLVMEFESEESLKKYAESPAQKEWYKVYLPIRGQSMTHDVTN